MPGMHRACTEHNFLRHAIDSPMRGHERLDLVATNASEIFGNTKIRDKPGVKTHWWSSQT